MKQIIFLLGMMLSLNSFAVYRSQGWNWYAIPAVDYSEDAPTQANTATPPESYSAQMERFQAHYKEALNKAVLTQDVEDVAYAARLHKWMIEQSQNYGNAMKQVLLKYPELSNEIKFPTAHLARQVAYQEKKAERKAAIEKLSKTHGLFYFYQGASPYDQTMAPSVQDLADEYGIHLIGFAVDGHPLPDIKHNKPHTKQMQHLGVKALPALMLVNPKTQASMPLAYGFIAQDDVKDRFVDLATNSTKEPLKCAE